MKINNKFTQSVAKAYYKSKFVISKHSPEIMIGIGIVGGIVSTVMACRATIKAKDAVEDTKKSVESIHYVLDGHVDCNETPDELRKDINHEYIECGKKLVIAYAPAVILGGSSIACILCGYKIMNNRTLALAAANATTMQMFKDYRENVIEKYGKEVDKELRCKTEDVVVTEKNVDPESGKEETITKVVKKHIPGYSDYARVFDELNTNWFKNPEYNANFLNSQQIYANQKLRSQGYLFLNDVYEALGYDKTRAGQVVGWIYNPNDDSRDSFVDFGLGAYHKNDENVKAFLSGSEASVWLDFNVDGDIINNPKYFDRI